MVQASLGDSEVERLLVHVNGILVEDESLKGRLPLTADRFVQQCQDGVVFCKLINTLVPGLIPIRLIQEDTSDPRRRYFIMLENYGLVLEAAHRIKCTLVNIAPSDLVDGGKGNLLYGLLWQVVKNGILMQVGSEYHPHRQRSVFRAQNINNDTKSMDEQHAENSLLRWINSTINPHNTLDSSLSDLKKGLCDGIYYGRLISTLYPQYLDYQMFSNLTDPASRAQAIVNAGKDILGSKCILQVEDILKSNETMNILFLASVCRKVAQEMTHATQSLATVPLSGETLKDNGDDEDEDNGDDIDLVSKSLLELKISELITENESLRQQLFKFQTCKIDTAIEYLDKDDGASSLLLFPKQGMEIQSCIGNVIITERDSLKQDDEIPTCPISMELPPLKFKEKSSISLAFVESVKEAFLEDAVRLRQIYYLTKDFLPLLGQIYGTSDASILLQNATMSGYLTKKSVSRSRWNKRFAIIKDNFIIFYKGERDSHPTSIEKLDDCLVRNLDGVHVKLNEPVLSIEVSSKVNPHFFYITTDIDNIKTWRDTIIRTSSWWVNRQ